MNYLGKRNLKEDIRYFDNLAKCRVYCSNCGHSIILATRDRTICSNCGLWVYKDEKTRFKYELKKEMIKNGK